MKLFDLTPALYSEMIPVLSKFSHVGIVKPYGSCLTNAEKYLIASGYNQDQNVVHKHIIPSFNRTLCIQIEHLTNLVTNGFNLTVNEKINYQRNKLTLEDVDAIPYYLFPMLSSLRFSEQLYPESSSCHIFDEVTLLSDRYLRFRWDVPTVMYDRSINMLETSIGYESKSIALQQTFTSHYGVVMEDGLAKHFLIFEKESACLFSDKYESLAIVEHPISSLPINQLTIEQLLRQKNFKLRFPSMTTFHMFVAHMRQLSLSSLLYYQHNSSVNSATNMIIQFFREAETMHLFYSKEGSVSRVRNTRVKHSKSIDFRQISCRDMFFKKHQSNIDRGKTARESFYSLFNEFTLEFGDSELFETSFCTTRRSYIEYTTQQICVSQPAAVHLRRSKYF